MISFFDLFAVLILLTAAFGWVNRKFFGLPSNIELLLMGVLSSLLLVGIDRAIPGANLLADFGSALAKIDFYDAVMNGMLAFLLFAGALHVDWQRLKRRFGSVTALATLGVVLSTFIIGAGFWLLAGLFGLNLPLPWALVFGALISPTDPVAVLSMLKSTRVPELLETEIAGESLFNDGVGVVLFTLLLTIAASGDTDFSVLSVVGIFLLEAIGGALFGLLAGYVAFQAMRLIDDYAVEIFISLALVTTTYALARHAHISGPIAVVVAGLLIGERGPTHAMSERTQRYLFGFWTVVDEILNSILFLLIGLELLVLDFKLEFGGLALCMIPLVLLARLAAIGIPITILSAWVRFVTGSIPVMVWGGIRGGISIALALSIPYGDERAVILTATYAVVLFTIIVQGLTMPAVIRQSVPSAKIKSARRN